MSSLDSFKDILLNIFGSSGQRGGGRRPTQQNQDARDADTEQLWISPLTCQNACRLTIVQITDVYTLDNFASLKTLLETIRTSQQEGCDESNNNNKVISMLTGDFLAPYLLSSVDRGAGMMMAIQETPIDILTWGNHEADIDHRTVCRHARNFHKQGGIWINSNMQSHDAMQYQVPYHVVEITSPDGSQKKRIGFVAVLSNDPKLYSHFKSPGAFGGAKIDDPWMTLRKYEKILREEEHCDLVIPLEHLYLPENEKTCEDFDCFPVVLSGHDHHRVDEICNNGTRIIKPGMDGIYATVLEIVWDNDPNKPSPTIRSNFVEVAKYEPCPILKAKTDAAYDVLLPLRNTMLAAILPTFRPLTSKNARGSTTTMGKLICSMIKASLFQTQPDDRKIDAVLLMGGNIRANEDYDENSFFSLETLESEIKSDEVIGIVLMPGHVLSSGIESTHSGPPIPGWFQYDDGITEENGQITKVAGQPLDPHRMYRVATKVKDLTNGQSPPMTKYYKEYPELLPAKGAYINIHSELMGFFARNLFRKLWDATGELIPDVEEVAEDHTYPPNMERIEGRLRLSVLDQDDDGILSVDDIHVALRDFLGLSVDEDVKTLATQIHEYADITGNGMVTVDDFELFCTGLPKELRLPHKKWHKAFPEFDSEANLAGLVPASGNNSVAEEAEVEADAASDGTSEPPSMDYDPDEDEPNMKRHGTEVTILLKDEDANDDVDVSTTATPPSDP